MSEMTNPHDALTAFQAALINDIIHIQRAERHASIVVHFDKPQGQPRYTYAEIENDVVNAVALLALAEPIQDAPCFQLGYAVRKDCRGQGKGHAIVAAAIDEFVTGSQRAAAGRALYIEAVVGRDNAASHAIARNALGEPAEEGTDDRSGEPATQYLRRFDL